MPNHVTNIITSDHHLDLIKSLIINPEGEVDFNLIVPMPEGMADIVSGSSLSWLSNLIGQPDNAWSTPPDPERLKQLRPEDFINFGKALQFKIDTGFYSWYEWSNHSWGTKWNAYDEDVCEDQIVFNTAWASPVPFFEALARRLPADVKFTVDWSDEGGPSGRDEYVGGL